MWSQKDSLKESFDLIKFFNLDLVTVMYVFYKIQNNKKIMCLGFGYNP